MRLETIKFSGIEVGVRVVADTPQERVLLRALAELPAKPDTDGSAPCARLELAPNLPWDNVGD